MRTILCNFFLLSINDCFEQLFDILCKKIIVKIYTDFPPKSVHGTLKTVDYLMSENFLSLNPHNFILFCMVQIVIIYWGIIVMILFLLQEDPSEPEQVCCHKTIISLFCFDLKFLKVWRHWIPHLSICKTPPPPPPSPPFYSVNFGDKHTSFLSHIL